MSKISKIRLNGQDFPIDGLKKVELTQSEYDALDVKNEDTLYLITDAEAVYIGGNSADIDAYTKDESDKRYGTLSEQKQLRSDVEDVMGEVASLEADKQDKIEGLLYVSEVSDDIDSITVSKTYLGDDRTIERPIYFKKINGQSILGEGNITIEGGGGSEPTVFKYNDSSFTIGEPNSFGYYSVDTTKFDKDLSTIKIGDIVKDSDGTEYEVNVLNDYNGTVEGFAFINAAGTTYNFVINPLTDFKWGVKATIIQNRLSGDYVKDVEIGGGYITFNSMKFDGNNNGVKTANFKTINGQPILGTGDITIQGGGGGSEPTVYTYNYYDFDFESYQKDEYMGYMVPKSMFDKNISNVKKGDYLLNGDGLYCEVTYSNDKNLFGFIDTYYGKVWSIDVPSNTDYFYARLTNPKDNMDGLKLKKLTQSEYDSLTSKDKNTLYIIVD